MIRLKYPYTNPSEVLLGVGCFLVSLISKCYCKIETEESESTVSCCVFLIFWPLLKNLALNIFNGLKLGMEDISPLNFGALLPQNVSVQIRLRNSAQSGLLMSWIHGYNMVRQANTRDLFFLIYNVRGQKKEWPDMTRWREIFRRLSKLYDLSWTNAFVYMIFFTVVYMNIYYRRTEIAECWYYNVKLSQPFAHSELIKDSSISPDTYVCTKYLQVHASSLLCLIILYHRWRRCCSKWSSRLP
jgi:hypothetical protein